MKVIVIDAAARTIEHHELADTKAIVDFFPNGISYCGALDTGDVVYIDDLVPRHSGYDLLAVLG